jgi:2'-5' RNA ligase
MKEISQLMPGYRVNEYLVVLSPHEELRNRIIRLKKEFHDSYPGSQALWGKPHLTLVRFKQLEMMEDRILNRLKTVAMGFHPIKIELKDFGSFPAHTIFIQGTTNEPRRNLVKEIRQSQRMMKLDSDNTPHFIEEPNFIISRRLLPWQYEKGWLEYSNRNFTSRFIADGMLLLKRREGDKAWQIAQRLEFMNLPVATRQGELFG